MPAEVRRISPDDWRDWRALRLEALQAYPLGFVRTYEESLALGEDDWRAWLGLGAFWLAAQDGTDVGMCGIATDDDATWMGAVYVREDVRGGDVLDALLAEAVAEARRRGEERLLLEVHEDNPRAQRAYDKRGFVLTGRLSPYPLPPYGQEREMALAL